jgi:hypothetical protein
MMPPADNSRFLVEAARRRHVEARGRCERAISAAADGPTQPTVVAISKAAAVSRSWLYTQPDLLAAIAQLRTGGSGRWSTVEPASDDSVRRRLDTVLARNKELRSQVTELTRQLEAVHGELRRTRAFAAPKNLDGP